MALLPQDSREWKHSGHVIIQMTPYPPNVYGPFSPHEKALEALHEARAIHPGETFRIAALWSPKLQPPL